MLAGHLAQLKRRGLLLRCAIAPDNEPALTWLRAMLASHPGLQVPGAVPNTSEDLYGFHATLRPDLGVHPILAALNEGQHQQADVAGLPRALGLSTHMGGPPPASMLEELHRIVARYAHLQGLPHTHPLIQAFSHASPAAVAGNAAAVQLLHEPHNQPYTTHRTPLAVMRAFAAHMPPHLQALLPGAEQGQLSALINLHHAIRKGAGMSHLHDAIAANAGTRQFHGASHEVDYRPGTTIPEDYYAMARKR